MKKLCTILLIMLLWSGLANATTFTTTSLTTEGTLPAGITEVGGMVLDLVGTNGTRVVSQLAASSLFVGFFGTNPGTIGTQTGFDAATMAALGGGISEAAVRLTVYDGDTAAGDFDFNDNFLQLNGFDFGNFSTVLTEVTDSSGLTSLGQELGFANNSLNTGFFLTSDATVLSGLYASMLSTNSVTYSLFDTDSLENFFDFTQGVDGSLINVGTGPVVTPPGGPAPVPEPGTFLLLGSGLFGLAFARRKMKK